MKNSLLTAFILFACIQQSYSQCFKTNPGSGQVERIRKVLVDGKTKDEIFNKLVVWGTLNQSSQYEEKHNDINTGQQTIKDKEIGIYKTYLQLNYRYKEGFRTIKYAVTMQVYDGYFQYTFNDFIMNKKPMSEFIRLKQGDEFYNAAFTDICSKLIYTWGELEKMGVVVPD